MTTDDTATSTETTGESMSTATPAGPTKRNIAIRLSRRFRQTRIGMFLNRTAVLKVFHLLTSVLLAIAVVLAVLHQQSELNQAQRASDNKRAAQNTFIAAQKQYAADQQIYQGKVDQYDTCTSKVITHNQLRVILLGQVDLSKLFPGNKLAEEYTAQKQAAINAPTEQGGYPQLDQLMTCGPPVPAFTEQPPVAPKGLFP